MSESYKKSDLDQFDKIIANKKTDLKKDEYSIKDAIFKKYINTIINNDCHFQLNILLQKKFAQWNNNTKWVYKFSTFPNYAIFIKEICIKKNSNKCKELILSYINNCSRNKKHKKIRTINNRWSN